MSEATAQEPAPEPPLDVTAVMQLAIDRVTENTRTTEQVRQILARIEQILAGHADRAGLDGLVTALVIASHRQAEQGADLREIPGAIADATLFTAAGLTGPMAAVPGPVTELAPRRRRAGSHRDKAARPPVPSLGARLGARTARRRLGGREAPGPSCRGGVADGGDGGHPRDRRRRGSARRHVAARHGQRPEPARVRRGCDAAAPVVSLVTADGLGPHEAEGGRCHVPPPQHSPSCRVPGTGARGRAGPGAGTRHRRDWPPRCT